MRPSVPNCTMVGGGAVEAQMDGWMIEVYVEYEGCGEMEEWLGLGGWAHSTLTVYTLPVYTFNVVTLPVFTFPVFTLPVSTPPVSTITVSTITVFTITVFTLTVSSLTVSSLNISSCSEYSSLYTHESRAIRHMRALLPSEILDQRFAHALLVTPGQPNFNSAAPVSKLLGRYVEFGSANSTDPEEDQV